jgi:hypothetical protein
LDLTRLEEAGARETPKTRATRPPVWPAGAWVVSRTERPVIGAAEPYSTHRPRPGDGPEARRGRREALAAPGSPTPW